MPESVVSGRNERPGNAGGDVTGGDGGTAEGADGAVNKLDLLQPASPRASARRIIPACVLCILAIAVLLLLEKAGKPG